MDQKYVLGIDVSSHAIDLILLNETGVKATWINLQLEGKTSFDRLRRIPEQMPPAAFYDTCYLAAIERPKTRFMSSAAALFPVFGAVVAHLPTDLEVWDVPPTTWRHGLALKGNAKKHEVAEAVCKLASNGAPDHPIWNWSQDAYDAYAVAYYARELNTRGVALDEAREKQLTVV